MPKFSGSFSGKATQQSALAPKDRPNHELLILEVNGPQQSSDPKWKDSKITYWEVADLVEGSGTHRGYFVNVHADGDTDLGTYEGKVKTAGGQTTIEGTWAITSGTGKLKGITGKGAYKGRMLSPTEVENTWEGAYEIAAAKAAG